MNFRIIFHLFMTDWRRFKWLLVGLWICVFLSALQWLFFDPSNGGIPIYNSASSVAPEDRVRLLHWIGSSLGLCYAAALGLGSREWGLAVPVRKRELMAARIGSVVIWVLVPQMLLVGLSLLLRDLGLAVALRETVVYGLTVGLVLAVVAGFASWCASWRMLLAGVAAAAVLHAFCGMIPELGPLPLGRFYQHLWATVLTVDLWPLAGAAVLLGGLRFGWGCRGTERSRVAAAVVIGVLPLALAGLFGHWQAAAFAPTEAGRNTSIRAVIREGSARMQSSSDFWYFTSQEMMPGYNQERNGDAGSRVGAIIDIDGCPDGWFVRWMPAGRGGLARGGRVIAPQLPEQPNPHGFYRPWSNNPLADLAADELAAITASLPGKTPPIAQPSDNGVENKKELRYLGRFAPDGPEVGWDEGPLALECYLTGTTYRYERVIDVPLGKVPVEVRVGQTLYRMKRHGLDSSDGWVEMTVTRPGAKAPATDSSIDMPPIRGFLHVPGENANLLLDEISSHEGPLLAGARWERRCFGNQWLESMNRVLKTLGEKNLRPDEIRAVHRLNRLSNADEVRFVLLEPRRMALLPDLKAVAEVRQHGTSERRSDYGLFYGELINEWIFLRDHLAKRPDPRTCTDEEFFRWLRVIGRWRNPDLAARELACYGRRFGVVIADLPELTHSMGESGNPLLIETAIPDAALADVPKRVDAVNHPDWLIDALIRRGRWEEISPAVRRRFLKGDIPWDFVNQMRLEDPTLYDGLIGEFIKAPSRISYDGIRLLPGIGDRVDHAIDRAVADESLEQAMAFATRYGRHFDPFWIYPIAAGRGNAKALDAMLAIRKAVDRPSDERLNIDQLLDKSGHEREGPGWSDKVFDHKSAADFRFDAKAGIWRPISTPMNR